MEAAPQEALGLTIVLGGGCWMGCPRRQCSGSRCSGPGRSVSPCWLAVFVSNIPESIAATASLRGGGLTTARIYVLWSVITVACALAAGAGYAFLDGASPDALAFIYAFAAGAILTMLATSMMPEAFEHAGRAAGLATVFGTTVAFALDWASGRHAPRVPGGSHAADRRAQHCRPTRGGQHPEHRSGTAPPVGTANRTQRSGRCSSCSSTRRSTDPTATSSGAGSILELARTAEAAGFMGFAFTEHPAPGHGGCRRAGTGRSTRSSRSVTWPRQPSGSACSPTWPSPRTATRSCSRRPPPPSTRCRAGDASSGSAPATSKRSSTRSASTSTSATRCSTRCSTCCHSTGAVSHSATRAVTSTRAT